MQKPHPRRAPQADALQTRNGHPMRPKSQGKSWPHDARGPIEWQRRPGPQRSRQPPATPPSRQPRCGGRAGRRRFRRRTGPRSTPKARCRWTPESRNRRSATAGPESAEQRYRRQQAGKMQTRTNPSPNTDEDRYVQGAKILGQGRSNPKSSDELIGRRRP